jgi:hypothetical protein
MHTGGCHCGAIRYEVDGEPMHHALCHCSDCRKHAGAPMVGWAMCKTEQVRVTKGTPITYASSEHGRRQFCGSCGTGLFYINNDNLPGITDVQSGTLDHPEFIPAQVHIQTAERLPWMAGAHNLPEFDRFPEPGD